MAKVIVRQQLGKIRVELDTGDLSIDVDSDGNGYQTAHALAPFMQALCDSCDAAHAALVDAHYAKGGVPAAILSAPAADIVEQVIGKDIPVADPDRRGVISRNMDPSKPETVPPPIEVPLRLAPIMGIAAEADPFKEPT